LSKKDWLNTATIEDAVQDLHATGYKPHQIVQRLKVSEQIVNQILEEQSNE